MMLKTISVVVENQIVAFGILTLSILVCALIIIVTLSIQQCVLLVLQPQQELIEILILVILTLVVGLIVVLFQIKMFVGTKLIVVGALMELEAVLVWVEKNILKMRAILITVFVLILVVQHLALMLVVKELAPPRILMKILVKKIV